MAGTLTSDPRIDPRIKAFFGDEHIGGGRNFDSREQMLAEENSEKGREQAALVQSMLDSMDREDLAPSKGLRISVETFVSSPDGNSIKVQFIRPDTDERLPCIYYIHGGGMASMSCFDGHYRTWGRMLANEGVAVAMVDFRNCVRASSAPEVEPFPAGLNDCVSGIKWLLANADRLNIDPARVIIEGESGGANLSIATTMTLQREGKLDLIKGLYLLCPYIAGQWPAPNCPSSIENNGILADLHCNEGAIGYGIEAFEAGNPLAWPSFATTEDVVGFPPTVVSVHECDPLRDEGVNFYRLLLQSGVEARCRQIMGATHAVEIFPVVCPDLSLDAAAHIARFCKG